MNPMKQVSQARIPSPLLAGLVYSFLVMGIATVLVSLYLMLSEGKEEALPTYAYAIHGLSLLFGSFAAGKKAGRKGWYFGGLLGVVYGLTVLCIGFLGFDRGFDLQTLAFTAVAFVMGAIGGIFGVNAKK